MDSEGTPDLTSGGPLLDVDGGVVSAEVLVQRIEQLMASIDLGQSSSEGVEDMPPDVDRPIHAMRIIHREMHPPDLSGARGLRGRLGASVKRLVRRLTSWYVEPRLMLQENFNSETIEFSSLIFNEVHNSLRRFDLELDELRRQNARLKLQLVDANERLSRYQYHVGNLIERTAHQRDILDGVAMRAEVEPLSKEVAAILERLRAVGTTGADINYVDFEDRFRGDDDSLAASQQRYLSLFPPPFEAGRIVDIGCGRGEMLSLLIEQGHDALGVDLDAGMVKACTEKGLPAVQDDGLHFLAQTPRESLKGIFCAQVVEHLITPEMEQLVQLSFDSLRRGGVLVIETINPRSSFALGNHFYADTSHVRPVHPETLRFICEQIGFVRVQLEERSPHPSLALAGDLPDGSVGEAVGTLLENVFGYQDYVVVATK